MSNYIPPQVFRYRIEALFKEAQIDSYRESRSSQFVEFLLFKENIPGTYVELRELLKLSKLLGTKEVMVTGFDVGKSHCGECNTTCADLHRSSVYIAATSVQFKD